MLYRRYTAIEHYCVWFMEGVICNEKTCGKDHKEYQTFSSTWCFSNSHYSISLFFSSKLAVIFHRFWPEVPFTSMKEWKQNYFFSKDKDEKKVREREKGEERKEELIHCIILHRPHPTHFFHLSSSPSSPLHTKTLCQQGDTGWKESLRRADGPALSPSWLCQSELFI